jgi:hypothetical protein
MALKKCFLAFRGYFIHIVYIIQQLVVGKNTVQQKRKLS